MPNIVNDIVERFAHLSLDDKKSVLAYLQTMVEAQESEPEQSYLEEMWEEIENLLYDLSLEPYIDDQMEIEEIWKICETLRKSGELKKEPWKNRKRILMQIIDHEYFDEYGVYDPMYELLYAMLLTAEEGVWCAAYMEKCSGYMKEEAAKLYKKYGEEEQYMVCLEATLAEKAKPYEELVAYYSTRDAVKAMELAELGRKKCRGEDLTEFYVFLVKLFQKKGEEAYVQKLLKSAKARRMVNTQVVWDEYDKMKFLS